MNNNNHDRISFLTLGDGDFTYSLDLGRYLLSNNKNGGNPSELIATGIDTKEQLCDKYKDAPFILKQLESLSSSSSSSSSKKLSVSIHHGINAIVSRNGEKVEPAAAAARMIMKADHVMFHHPHLGTEDAALHTRFLSHLFYSVSNHWMKWNGGIFHLTLVSGQCERWKCLEAAKRHGLCLLSRQPFSSPPPPISTTTPATYYHLRRHQTGKSFQSRRPDNQSESFTFGRNNENWIAKCLPWQRTTESELVDERNDNSLSCPFCERIFREERSRKSHIRAKHPDGSDKKPKLLEFICHQCSSSGGNKPAPARYFASETSLRDHILAKHSALHKQISPDWKQNDVRSAENKDDLLDDVVGSCDICNVVYHNEQQRNNHMTEFIPKDHNIIIITESYQCQFCNKSFREKRASLQHENFCPQRVKN